LYKNKFRLIIILVVAFSFLEEKNASCLLLPPFDSVFDEYLSVTPFTVAMTINLVMEDVSKNCTTWKFMLTKKEDKMMLPLLVSILNTIPADFP